MQANPMHFMLMGAHRGKGAQSISDLCVPVVRRLESKWKGRAAVTCHTTTMFAFLWRREAAGVLIRHADKHWIGLGLTGHQLSLKT